MNKCKPLGGGGASRVAAVRLHPHGKAVQVGGPRLTSARVALALCQRLNLKYDEPFSIIGLGCKLRRY
jgi:hypothetical protein